MEFAKNIGSALYNVLTNSSNTNATRTHSKFVTKAGMTLDYFYKNKNADAEIWSEMVAPSMS